MVSTGMTRSRTATGGAFWPDWGTASIHGAWKPTLFLQGGGAKGAWQAGVLRGMLGSSGFAPVAVFGSSAGAINALALSIELENPGEDSLWNVWRTVAGQGKGELRHHWRMVAKNVPIAAGQWFVRQDQPIRSIVPFEALEGALQNALSGWGCAKLYTFISAVDVDQPLPQIFTDRNLFEFALHHGDVRARRGYLGDPTVPVWRAAAASSCLPGVQPGVFEGHRLADGGIYSNLPVDALKRGYGFPAIAVVARQVQDLDASDLIDFRTLQLLHQLRNLHVGEKARQADQRDRSLKVDKFGSRHSIWGGSLLAHHAVFVVQPDRPLRSALIKGFLRPALMRRDFDEGFEVGRRFRDTVLASGSGDDPSLRHYMMWEQVLPALPADQPRPGRWARFVNPSWRAVQG